MNAFQIALTSACTLVTLNYIALKIRTRVEAYEYAAVPLLTGIASIVIMLQPLPGWYMLDLGFAPIIMAGLRFGLGSSLLSTIPPVLYLLAFIPDSLVFGLSEGLLIPAVVSGLFHRKDYQTGYASIRMRDGLLICVLLSVVRILIGYVLYKPASTVDWLYVNAAMLLISAVTVLVLIVMFNDDSKTWLAQRQLEMLANQDELTRLPNLRSFLEIARNTFMKQQLSILMIDIDNFKQYNDQHGHLAGDQLLREIGQMLRNLIRDQDYVARYGGEEFIVMCLSSEPRQLNQIANRLCTTVANHKFAGQEQQSVARISISIGISVSVPADDNLQQVIAEADEALYESKRNGKNQFTFYAKELQQNEAASGN